MTSADIRIPTRYAGQALKFFAVANVLMLAGTALRNTQFDSAAPGARVLAALVQELDMGAENSIGAWYSSMLLLTTAIVAFLCFAADSRTIPIRPRPRYGWLALGLLFTGLSFDEAESVHEVFDQAFNLLHMVSPFQGGFHGWVEVLAIPIVVVGGSIVAFAGRHLKQTPAALVLMVLGALLYLSVPLQEHVELTLVALSGGPEHFIRPALHTVLEEGAELLGTTCFLSSGLVYALFSPEGGFARRPAPRQELRLTLDPVRFRRVTLRAIAVLGAILLVTAFAILPALPLVHPVKGPLGWFPAMTAFLAAAVCLHIVAGRRRLAGRRRREAIILLALSVFSIGLSADFGAGQLLTRRFWQYLTPSGTAHLAAVTLAVAAALALAAGLSTIWRGRARGAAVGWGVLVSAALLSTDPIIAVAWAFAGYALLLPALLEAGRPGVTRRAARSAPPSATGHIPACPSPSSIPSSARTLVGAGHRTNPPPGASGSPRFGISRDSFDSSGTPSRDM